MSTVLLNKVGLMVSVVVLVMLVAGCLSAPVTDKSVCRSNDKLEAISNLFDTQWELFKVKYNKTYENEKEEAQRKDTFLEQLQKINDHNRDYYAGKVTFEMGENQFLDITAEEFGNNHFGFGTTSAANRRGLLGAQHKSDSNEPSFVV